MAGNCTIGDVLNNAGVSAGISIGDAVTGGTTGSVLFVDGSGNLGQDNANLFWDDTNNRLGIGTTTPTFSLHIDAPQSDGMIINKNVGAQNSGFQMYTQTSNNALVIYEELASNLEYPSVYITINQPPTSGFLSYVNYTEIAYDEFNSFGFGVGAAVWSSDNDLFISGVGGTTTFKLSEATDEFVFTNGRMVYPPEANQALLAAGTINVASARVVQVSGSGGVVTLTSTPTISDGANGQIVTIVGTDDTNTLTVQDDSNLAGSNLQLSGGTNFTLGQGDTLTIMFHADTGDWVELSRSDN